MLLTVGLPQSTAINCYADSGREFLTQVYQILFYKLWGVSISVVVMESLKYTNRTIKIF